jgi:hypothetical protein
MDSVRGGQRSGGQRSGGLRSGGLRSGGLRSGGLRSVLQLPGSLELPWPEVRVRIGEAVLARSVLPLPLVHENPGAVRRGAYRIFQRLLDRMNREC